ncbi:hypothetical protein [Stackebrandtia soli]|uniref:hypothetical protein n=1 Tax=Stackebrandtia soli TaxID=1892856 RepID=UPI0039E87978
MDVDSPVSEYARACAAYTDAVVHAHAARAKAEERYRDEVARVRVVAERAVAAREAAQKRATSVDAFVGVVDDTAADLWRRTAEHTTQPGLGPTPAPVEPEREETAAEIRARLKDVAKLLGQARNGKFPLPAPPRATAIAAGAGAAVAVFAVVAASLLLSGAGAPHGMAPFLRAAALVVLFLGLVAGVPVVTGWLALRHRITPEPVHIAACVVAAIAATAVLTPIVL